MRAAKRSAIVAAAAPFVRRFKALSTPLRLNGVYPFMTVIDAINCELAMRIPRCLDTWNVWWKHTIEPLHRDFLPFPLYNTGYAMRDHSSYARNIGGLRSFYGSAQPLQMGHSFNNIYCRRRIVAWGSPALVRFAVALHQRARDAVIPSAVISTTTVTAIIQMRELVCIARSSQVQVPRLNDDEARILLAAAAAGQLDVCGIVIGERFADVSGRNVSMFRVTERSVVDTYGVRRYYLMEDPHVDEVTGLCAVCSNLTTERIVGHSDV